MIDASYVGSRTLGINTNSNQAGGARNLNVPTVTQLNQARQDANYFNAQVPNPFAGLLPGTGFNGATIQRRQLLLPYPQFGSVQMAWSPSASSGTTLSSCKSKSATARADPRGFLHLVEEPEALSFLNDQDAEPAKGELSATDRPHRLVMSGVYQLPFGRGRRLAVEQVAD